MKEWIYCDFDDCPNCGDDLMVLVDTEDLQDGEQLYEDGADVKCIDCLFRSALTVDVELNEISVQDGNVMELPEE
jgi:hypothetical protein